MVYIFFYTLTSHLLALPATKDSALPFIRKLKTSGRLKSVTSFHHLPGIPKHMDQRID